MQIIEAPPDTVNALLTGAGLDRSDAKVLLRHALGCNDAWLIAHGTDRVDADICRRFHEFVARRNDGEPVAYITGTREFFGREFSVSPAVLIPRPETELLVELALPRFDKCGQVLDLGTGSGCIGITLAAERRDATITLVDISTAALELAQKNASRWAPENTLLRQSNWFDALGNRRYDLIVANPPYVAENDPHLGKGDLRFEPRTALAAGLEGLDELRRIVAEAPGHLNVGGWLLLEHGYDQGESCRDALYKAGFTDVFTETDLAGQPRVSGGQLPGS